MSKPSKQITKLLLEVNFSDRQKALADNDQTQIEKLNRERERLLEDLENGV